MSKKMPPAMKYLLLPFYGTYLKLRYGLKTEGFEKVLPFDGPAVVFSNHTHVLDPFLISARYPYHIRWVTGAHLFHLPLVSWLLEHWVYAISKTQGRSDLETIRETAKALKNGDIVGLFPEGTRTWDGDTTDIVKGTAKLVRLFKVPVVFINIECGFARKPRWSDTDGKEKISLRVSRVLTPEEIAGMKIDEIAEVVHENLSFSHAGWIGEHPERTRPEKGIAEGSERLFYACPCCHGVGTIKSRDNGIECSCGAKGVIHGDYTIESSDFGMKSLPEWHRWEYGYLKELLRKDASSPIFPVERGILFEKTDNGREIKVSKDFEMKVYSDRFSFDFGSKELDGMSKVDFDFENIESVIICAKQTIEFYYDGQQYRFRPEGRISSLKYQEIYLAWKERESEAR